MSWAKYKRLSSSKDLSIFRRGTTAFDGGGGGGGNDPDAQAYIDALDSAGYTVSGAEETAINTFVVDLKADGIWAKSKAIYPFIGGTAATHKFNIKDPRDLNAAYRLTFFGGWTHSATGAKPNGTNGYADTFIDLATMNSINDISYGYYCLDNTVSFGSFGWGVGSPNVNNEFYIKYLDSNKYGYLFDNADDGGAAGDCRGFNAMSRTAFNVKYIQINNSITTYSSISSGTLISRNFLFARGAQGYENRTNALGFVGNGLTNTELSNFYTAVQALQTALNREV